MAIEEKKCRKNIEVLNETLWERRVLEPEINAWLSNFEEKDQLYALYLLSKMMYFNASSIRNLLKALYRDLYRYPIIKKVREDFGHTLDESFIEAKFKEELRRTRFLGVGNPSESGVHLLYYFRQENKIPKRLFVNTDDVVHFYNSGRRSAGTKNKYDFSDVAHYVFIDDLCGSGAQATSDDSNVKRCVEQLKAIVPDAEVSYLMLFGVTKGVEVVDKSKLYDHVEALIELDESYKCFGDESRYFSIEENDVKNKTKQIAFEKGKPLIRQILKQLGWSETHPLFDVKVERNALGWGDCQLLLSLHHNTPDNTLPIMWFDEDDKLWTPIFKRYNKVYE
jgi:hypothetical protein